MKRIIIVVFIFLTGVCLYFNHSNILKNTDKITNNDYIFNKDAHNTVDTINLLKEQYNNSDIIGIITVDALNKNIVVAKTKDNEFYLTHNLEKNIDKYGAVFMDYRNNIDDQKIIIYGHNSKVKDVDFHFLENYLDESYLKSNPYIYFKTENFERKYKIFSVMVQQDNEHTRLGFNDARNYLKHLELLKERSIYQINSTLNDYNNSIILQTCNMDKDNEYIIIAAYEV